MNTVVRQSIIILSAATMLGLAVITLLAPVIAPACTGIMNISDAYKISSLCIFLSLFYLSAWRKRSAVAAVIIPSVQIGAGYLFIKYINGLPLICAQ